MSTEYIPKLLVGCYFKQLVDVKICNELHTYKEYKGYSFLEYMEMEYGMFYVDNEGFIGFEINVEESIDINIKEAYNLQTLAKKFKAITGQDAKLKACVYSY